MRRQRYSTRRTRRLLAVGGVTGMMAMAGAGIAGAQPPPDQCAPGAVMRAHAAAMTQMADYLDSHPDVAQVFVDARGKATPQERHDVIEAYVDAHPDVAGAFRNIHQPVQDLSSRCGLPMMGPGMHGGMGYGPMGGGPMGGGR